MSNTVVYSYTTNRSGDTSANMGDWIGAFRFTNFPLIVAFDGGFAGCFDTSNTRAPATVNTTNQVYTPGVKSGYGGGSTKRDVTNAQFMANVIAWAIQRRGTQ